jgi:hypothetical protein
MYDDNIYARHHRGSSPPYQNSYIRLEDWMRSCRSIDQHPYNLTDIETLRQFSGLKIEFPANKLSDNYLPDEKDYGIDKR